MAPAAKCARHGAGREANKVRGADGDGGAFGGQGARWKIRLAEKREAGDCAPASRPETHLTKKGKVVSSRAAAGNEKQPQIAELLRVSTGLLSYHLRTNEEFRAAYNEGRRKGGFALYQPRGGAADNGDGTKLARPDFDDLTEEVLHLIKTTKGGISISDLEAETGADTLKVSSSIRTLTRHALVTNEGSKFVEIPGSDPPVPARQTNTPPRKSGSTKKSARSNGIAHGADADLAAVDYSALAGVAKAMERARVELLYTRAHGEASPKFDDVIEGLEQQLVKAVASV
jgi:hypothetical protein